MKHTHITKTLITLSVILLIGGSAAWAHGGFDNEWGHHRGGHHGRMADSGYGPAMGGGYGTGYGQHMRGHGQWANLSEEDQAKLDQLRTTFFKETQEIRGQIDENRVALRNEMMKDDPDQGKVFKLQKQISELQGNFDQKAIKHQLEVKKLFPDGYGYPGRGFGMGRGAGRGPGYCW